MTYIFRQLLDYESNTFTYLLGDAITRRALLIDPVLEMLGRDVKLLGELGLDLVYAINTHVHADHITSSGKLKRSFPQMKSVLGSLGNELALADIKVQNGNVLQVDSIALEFRSVPGHTAGCHVLVWQEEQRVFTGDTVLVRGCGRTDFQGGNAKSLYQSVWSQVFTLSDEFAIFPAHDYKGHSQSTIGEEKQFNPRLSKPLEEFEQIMNNLNLPYPRKIDVSLPANLVCGLHEV
ncbi:hypothetical protein BASA81_006586 [Batrachochytrium salamandrivorans]|nr:hypothetical protein BASA81_006586 [Batrachochytrium salamandrivorans]